MSRNNSIALGTAFGLLLGSGSAFGNPNDPTVVAGSAAFETVGSQLNVTNSNGAIIDWNSFSINQDEVTRFIQESASSAVLNRVTGGSISEILGDLQSNGRVFLINPNGLIVGENASIDTAGFIASTLDISNSDFISGNYEFNGEGGVIDNRGLIHVSGDGDIALIASSVENSGVLRSDNGDILLAAGESVSLSFEDLPNMSFEVQSPTGQATNLGDIIAKGGNAAILANNVNSSGSIELLESADGRIFLQASDTAIVEGRLASAGGDIHIEANQVELHGASLDSGNSARGGDISLLGDNVGLFSGTNVSATGQSGGGTVLVGGEQQGRGDTRTSEFVYLDQNASIRSDGGFNGDGGTVILFAENSARINGELTARGGLESGNGGFIETSGLLGFEINSNPDTSAVNGDTGTWLIDPYNITIVSDGGTTGVEGGATSGVFTAVSSGATISAEDIANGLENNSIIIDTGVGGDEAGDIDINTAIVVLDGTDNSLTFNAANDINVNASVSLGTSGSGVLTFNADSDGDSNGSTVFDGTSFDNGGFDVPVINAGEINFVNGLTVTGDPTRMIDTFEIVANNISVTGGADVSADLVLSGNVTIDELNITYRQSIGQALPPIFISGELFMEFSELPPGPPGTPTELNIGSLNILGAVVDDPMFVYTPIIFSPSVNLTLTGESNIGLTRQVDPMASLGSSVIFSGSFTNEGILNFTGGGTFDVGFDAFGFEVSSAGLLNSANGVINIADGIGFGSNEFFTNDGTFNVLASTDGMSQGVDIFGTANNNGLINIDAGAELRVRTLELNQGEIHLADDFSAPAILNLLDDFDDPMNPLPVDLVVGNGSSITGNGIIDTNGGTVSVEAGGIIAPGNSPGAIDFTDNLTLFDGAILNLELEGADQSLIDSILVNGDLALGGPGSAGGASAPGVVVNVINLNGYEPDPTFSHNVLQVGGSITQSATPFNQSADGFDSLDLAIVGNSLGVQVSVTPPPAPPAPAPAPAPAPTPTVADPVAPVVEVAPDPIVEAPMMMTPPDDIINDVVALDVQDSDDTGFSISDRLGDRRQDSESEGGEIETTETQCR